jgi:hypothetical protein
MALRPICAAVLLALAPAAALAFEAVDTIPYPSRGAFAEAYGRDPTYPTTLWAQAGLMFDSNPFRLNDATNAQAALGKPERSDAVLRYGAGVGHVARVAGRQGVRLGARGEYFDYLRYDTLDHFAYGLLGEWLWEVTNDLSGTVGYGRTFDIGDPAQVQRAIKDEITTDRFYADAAYRFAASWRLRGAAVQGRAKRTGDRPGTDTDSTTLRAGIDYVTPLANAIGVEARRTEGSTPTEAFPNNDFTEDEVAAVLAYNLGAQLAVAGRLGHTTRDNSDPLAQDFDGNTGRASVTWRPGTKTALVLEAYREPRAILEVDATHVDVRGVRFGPSWAPLLKLVFSAQLVSERRRFQSAVDTGFPLRDETLRVLRFAAGWEPLRHFTLGGGVEYGERTSNTLGRDFDYAAVMANLRYDW